MTAAFVVPFARPRTRPRIRIRTGTRVFACDSKPTNSAAAAPHPASSLDANAGAGSGEEPLLKPPPVPVLPDTDVDTKESSDTSSDARAAPVAPAHLNSGMLSAMRDYFGDDGRETEAFCARPLNDDGLPMYRVMVLGSGKREVALCQKLAASDSVNGVYYAPDEENVCALGMPRFVTSTGSAADDADEVLRFARWALVDAIFVGPDREGTVPPPAEAELAAAGVTVFPFDVSAAVADGELDPADCLAPLGDSLPGDAVVVRNEFTMPAET